MRSLSEICRVVPALLWIKVQCFAGSLWCCLARLAYAPPGHFYSPIPSVRDTKKRHAELFDDKPRALPAIDLNEEGQLALLEEFAEYYREQPFSDQPGERRYGFRNPAYGDSDALCLYCMIRHARPRRIIEIGSGNSSCVTLDTNELFFDNAIRCDFIEPFPAKVLRLIRPDDRERISLLAEPLQAVPLAFFADMQAGDILFIDSSHVAKIGSDVNYLLFEVLPRLPKGVFIHVHDVLYPFQYLPQWIYGGVAWNETYFLRAFLQYNDAFRITYFNSFMEHFHRDKVRERMPLCVAGNGGGSLWLRKTADAVGNP